MKIALAGNPNCGKTTLFNALTGSNQFVGNWPGVTVEKKEGKLKKHSDVIITDLPGIYSLSPYTLEEVVARNYLIGEKPDAIFNIVDGTNLERNLYLTTQLIELGIPIIVAINMMDIVRKNGDKINIEELSDKLGCMVVEISAIKNEGVLEAAKKAIEIAKNQKISIQKIFSQNVEDEITYIEQNALNNIPLEKQRWYSIKLFERDSKVNEELKLENSIMEDIELHIKKVEDQMDDDSESIITNERYLYLSQIIKKSYKKKSSGSLTVSDKIDRIVTNRWLALPIFAVVMFLVYFIAVSTVGTWVTDFTNDGLFGDGWHLMGASEYNEAVDDYANEFVFTSEVKDIVEKAVEADVTGASDIQEAIQDADFGAFDEAVGIYGEALEENGYEILAILEENEAPDPKDYGVWVDSIPVLVENALESISVAPWLQGLIVNGIIGGVGAVLGFVPQMFVLFAMLAFLEACGYMSRIAFVLDRIFRKFGLSGKSFIPMLVGTGCGVPGIMASRTIENERDRRMTIITTTFIPCGAKLPIIALIASALFNGSWWVAPSAYFIGIGAIIVSGIMLKKTTLFAGDPAPFVMELPSYHMPTLTNIGRSMWERGWSFIKKAGTIILISSIVIWAGSCLGFVNGALVFSAELELESSILGLIGRSLSWIFVPLGFGNIKATIATIMGLVAKEEVVAVFGVLDFGGMSALAAYSFLIFNLLCAPCFAAMGAIKREMNSAKWTAFAIFYQCIFAYAISLIVFQFGSAITGNLNIFALICAIGVLGFIGYMLVKPYKENNLGGK